MGWTRRAENWGLTAGTKPGEVREKDLEGARHSLLRVNCGNVYKIGQRYLVRLCSAARIPICSSKITIMREVRFDSVAEHGHHLVSHMNLGLPQFTITQPISTRRSHL
jgi:hypothetical protein